MGFFTLVMWIIFLIVAFYVAWFVLMIVFWGLMALGVGIAAIWEAIFRSE